MDELLPLAEQIAHLLIARNQTIAVAEPSGGGLISAALLSVPGGSAYFLGGVVVYTRVSREAFLEITVSALENVRPSTEAFAALPARSARNRLGTTWAIGERTPLVRQAIPTATHPAPLFRGQRSHAQPRC